MARREKMDNDSGVWWIPCLPSSLNSYCEAQDVKNRRCHWERDTGDQPCLSALGWQVILSFAVWSFVVWYDIKLDTIEQLNWTELMIWVEMKDEANV